MLNQLFLINTLFLDNTISFNILNIKLCDIKNTINKLIVLERK